MRHSQFRVYQVTPLCRDGVHHRESAGTGPKILKVALLTGASNSELFEGNLSTFRLATIRRSDEAPSATAATVDKEGEMDAHESLEPENCRRSIAATRYPLSPRLACPVTPSRADGPPSPFTLFSAEKIERLRVVSPALSLAEVIRIVADQWDNLSEDAKTPYKDRADEERHRYDALDAALVLTQIGTPSFRPGVSTSFESRSTAKRCLDISTPDMQASSFAKKIYERDGPVEEVPSVLSLADWSPMRPLSPSGPSREEGARTPNIDVHAVPQTPAPSSGGGVPGYALDSDSQADDLLLRPDARKQGLFGEGKKSSSPTRDFGTAENKGPRLSPRGRRRAYKTGFEIISKMSKKDPNRPKRNRSSYIIFCNERRANLKEAEPGATTMDTGRLLGETWRRLSEEEKHLYTQKAKADRERYESDLITIGEKSITMTARGPVAASRAFEGEMMKTP